MTDTDIIEETFPEIHEIADEALRTKVVQIWLDAFEESAFESLDEVPWWPPADELVDHERQVPHIRDVTACAIAMVDTLQRRRPDLDVDRDLVVAGSLLHDVTKFYETDPDGVTELNSWLPHPHYSVHLLAKADCSLHLQHIVMAHTDNTNVSPRTLEAELVRVADELAVSGMLWEHAGELEH